MNNKKTASETQLRFGLGALGVLTLAAMGCAPLPPCPTTPEKPVVLASNVDALPQKSGDANALGGGSKAKKGPSNHGSGGVREREELPEESRAHFHATDEPPLPPACRPAS